VPQIFKWAGLEGKKWERRESTAFAPTSSKKKRARVKTKGEKREERGGQDEEEVSKTAQELRRRVGMNAGRRGAAQMRAKIQILGEAGSGGAPRYASATAASCSSAHVTCEKSKKKSP